MGRGWTQYNQTSHLGNRPLIDGKSRSLMIETVLDYNDYSLMRPTSNYKQHEQQLGNLN